MSFFSMKSSVCVPEKKCDFMKEQVFCFCFFISLMSYEMLILPEFLLNSSEFAQNSSEFSVSEHHYNK